jgi:hypothetical protein
VRFDRPLAAVDLAQAFGNQQRALLSGLKQVAAISAANGLEARDLKIGELRRGRNIADSSTVSVADHRSPGVFPGLFWHNLSF